MFRLLFKTMTFEDLPDFAPTGGSTNKKRLVYLQALLYQSHNL